jgi:phosphate transport system protein
MVIGSLRISSSLERMGDLAVHVAKQARMRYPNSSIPTELRATFTQLGALEDAIAAKTATVISTKDITLGPDIERYDSEVDRLHRELFTTVLSSSWSHGVEAAIDATLLSRYYERYADHAVSIARRVMHVVTGEHYADTSLEAPIGQ